MKTAIRATGLIVGSLAAVALVASAIIPPLAVADSVPLLAVMTAAFGLAAVNK